jgi:predicted dehydrogenase
MVASVWGSWADVANPMQLIIAGTEGEAWIAGGQLSYRRGADGEMVNIAPEAIPRDLGHAFELFLDAVAGDTTSGLVTPREAAQSTIVIESCYRAAQHQDWIVLDMPNPGSAPTA